MARAAEREEAAVGHVDSSVRAEGDAVDARSTCAEVILTDEGPIRRELEEAMARPLPS
jgi:hypothetical protein